MNKLLLTITTVGVLVAGAGGAALADPPYDYLPPCTIDLGSFPAPTYPISYDCEPYTIPGTSITLTAIRGDLT